MHTHYDRLKSWLLDTGGAVVAFSGGVDSSLLLAAAVDALGPRALAVTARSPSYPEKEFLAACSLAKTLQARHLVIETNELELPTYKANPPTRCYFCKKAMLEKLSTIAISEGLPSVLDGSNADDLRDHRPGRDAAKELGVRSPFIELNLGKQDIRQMAKARGLPNWNSPSQACLASRIPYGEEITVVKLQRIERAEELLHKLGFNQIRVRDHGLVARIEVLKNEIERVLQSNMSQTIVEGIKQAGYTYVCLDLEGYRTGAMNAALSSSDKRNVL